MGKYACMTSTVHADIKIIIVEHTMVGLSLAIYSSFFSESMGTLKISGQKNVFSTAIAITVEPPNKGHFGNGPLVLCLEVVPISEVHDFSTHFG